MKYWMWFIIQIFLLEMHTIKWIYGTLKYYSVEESNYEIYILFFFRINSWDTCTQNDNGLYDEWNIREFPLNYL